MMTSICSRVAPDQAQALSAAKTIGNLHALGRQDSFAADKKLAELISCFEADSHCFAVVIWDPCGTPRAIISRDTLACELTRPFALDLYRQRPMETLLEQWQVPLLAIPGSELIDRAVAQALARPAAHRYEPVLVQGEESWFLLEAHDLLAQQCEVLSETIAEVETQRQATIAVQQERERLHHQLVAASRDAGRAEIATGVLHNVGNVLNSVNVSATLMSRTLRESKLGNLGKALTLFSEHEHDLVAFLTHDERGLRLPGYLIKLAEVLCAEQKTMVEELQLMERSIEHIRQIVQMQQSYARSTLLLEPIRPAEVMDDALRVNLISFDRHHVKVQREFQELAPVAIDKHKILQILINLISNAKNSIKHRPPEERHIMARILTLTAADSQLLRFQISDNGIGIKPEDLTKIFVSGFTTRQDGHGFGLHSSANTAREMGGTLGVASDGPGKGAVFTLDIPIKEGKTP
jgi:signal transduction histidine kinase